MLEKTEWPNETRLQGLREAGIVSLSYFSCRCVVSLVFLCTLWLMRERILMLGADLRKLLSDSTANEELLKSILTACAQIALLPALAAGALAVIWALLQTRFLFRLGLAAANFSRLSKIRFPAVGTAFSRALLSLAQAVLILGAALLSARLCWTGVLYVLNNDRVYIGSWLPGMAQALLVPLLIVLSMLAVISWFAAKFIFLFRHRMTRQELEHEVLERDISV